MPGRGGVPLLVLLGLSACSPADTPIEIHFDARLNGAVAACGGPTDALHLTDLRFYVASPRLIGANGDAVPVILEHDERWQQADLGLIDLEDGSGACLNGTADTNHRLVGAVPAGDYTGLVFTVGVPFERNHADPLTANAPLDDSFMHWHWRSGYKFLRAGVAANDDNFWLHLGSAGCQGTVQHITGCDFPNRSTVTLNDYRPGAIVTVDLAAFAAAAELADGVSSDCVSGPGDIDCEAAFAVLGLNHESGTMSGVQQLFRIDRQ